MRRPQPRLLARFGGSAGIAIAALALALGIALVVVAAGLFTEPQRTRTPPPGTVAVPTAAVRIPAYAAVQLEHLVDPATGSLSVVYLPAGSILPETITQPEALLGRVLSTEKPAGLLFNQRDFLPDGTRPGLVAGIPAGKRALRIDAAQVGGITGLRAGDRFDLVATWKPATQGGQGAALPLAGAAAIDLQSRARVHVIVENGVVVTPLETRETPAAKGRSLVQEIVVAIDPAEVPPLTEALAAGARIDCVPRSGRPDDATAPVETRHPTSRDGIRYIDTIAGSQRQVIAVPEAPLDPLGGLERDPPLVSATPSFGDDEAVP